MYEGKKKIDGLEVFVKVKMGITLTEEELKIYNNYDKYEKKLIFDFINDPSFTDDLINITNKINSNNRVCVKK